MQLGRNTDWPAVAIGMELSRRGCEEIAHRDIGTILDREPTGRNQEEGTTEVEWWTPPTDLRGSPLGPWNQPTQNITTIVAHGGKVFRLYRL